MQLTFELMSVVISDTFWVARPPILMALCVAWEASFDADEENKDHPCNNNYSFKYFIDEILLIIKINTLRHF